MFKVANFSNMMKALSRRQKLLSATNRGSLEHCITCIQLVMLSLSATIGAGQYSVPGFVIQYTGPAVIFSYLITGLCCFFTAFPYAEMAGRVKGTGFSYSYIYTCYGEIFGYIGGQLLTFVSFVGIACCSRGWADCLAGFLKIFGINLTPWVYEIEIFNGAIILNPLACVIIVCLSVLVLQGMKDSAAINNAVATLNCVIIAFAIITGLIYTRSEHLSGFFDKGLHGIMQGAGLAFFGYQGFETVTCFTEEAQDPNKDMPFVLTTSLSLLIAFNVLLSFVMAGMAPPWVMDNSESLIATFRYATNPFITTVIAFGSIVTLVANDFALILEQPRIFYAMAKDGMLANVLASTNAKKVPEFATILTAVISCVFALILPVDVLGEAAALACLIISSIVDLGVVILRYEHPKNQPYLTYLCLAFLGLSFFAGFSFQHSLPDGVMWGVLWLLINMIILVACQKQRNFPSNYICPGLPYIPMFGALTFMFITGTVTTISWILVIGYQLLVIPIYFFYSINHSMLSKETALDANIIEKSLRRSQYLNKSFEEYEPQEQMIEFKHIG